MCDDDIDIANEKEKKKGRKKSAKLSDAKKS